MNRDEIDELAAAYALGGLEGEDRVLFEGLLEAGDPGAVQALRDCEDTLVGLAAAAPEAPPPGVKAALMERIAATPAPVRPLPRRPRPLWPVVLSGAMAAGLIGQHAVSSQRISSKIRSCSSAAVPYRQFEF